MRNAKIIKTNGCGKLYRFSVRYDEGKWSMCESFRTVEEAEEFCKSKNLEYEIIK